MRGAKGHATRRWTTSTVFLGALAVLALGATGCGKRLARMEQNQIRLEARVAANARQLAMVSSQVHVNNGEVQEGIRKLQVNDQDLATGLSTVQNQQDALRQAVASASDAIDRRMTALDANQMRLQEGVSQVAGVTQRTASDVSAMAKEQVTLHRMVASGKQELGDSIAAVAANGDRIRTDIGQLQQADQRMAEQIVALAAGQDRIRSGLDGMDKLMHTLAGDVTAISQGQLDLRRTVGEHNALFADKTAIMEQNQQNLRAAVDVIAGQTKSNAEGIAAVDARQTTLQQTLTANHKIVTGQVAAVIENQQGLQAGVNGLSEKIGQTNTHLTALAAGQDAVRETIRSDSGAVTARLAGLSESQTGLESDLTGLHQKADTLVSHVDAVRTGQASLRDALKANQEAAASRMTQLSGEQRQLQDQMNVLLATAGQTAIDVVAVSDGNAALQRAVQAGAASLAERTDRIDAGLAALATEQSATREVMTDQSQATLTTIREAIDNQKRLGSSLDGIAATAGQTAGDVKAAAARQDAIQQTLQSHNEAMSHQIAGLATSQQQMQNGLDAVTATTGQTALDVIAMTSRQDALRQQLQDHGKAVDGRMAGLAGSQEQINSSLDVVTATSGQTAIDVINMAAGQDTLTQSLRNQNETVRSQIANLARSQQQTQSDLDVVVATAGQTALDTISLHEGQASLAQAVQADRQALAGKLAEIVQSQQQWAQRFDAAQANVQTISANLTALEQHLTKLQGTLQPSLDGLASQLGADGQSRTQFETQVNHDIQAVVEAIAQLRQDQVSLTNQMQQIQAGTQTQTRDIITAIQQLRVPPAEVKVSNSGTKLESSVAEAAAK